LGQAQFYHQKGFFMREFKSYKVWDAGTRLFHWVNLLCVIGLATIGLVILYGKTLGISSDGKILLKTIHSSVGYVFALNLIWRFIWAFKGNHHARWQAMRLGRGYLQEVAAYSASIKSGQPKVYLGHNPIGRLSVVVLFLLLTTQAITGLVLAGTDLFYPPFGHWIAQWVAAPGVDPGLLVPNAPHLYDSAAYASMREYRKIVVSVHVYGFYVLAGLIVLHIAAVVVTELRTGSNLVSVMITGKKILSQKPVDD
jgi:Ni/Fe-hydrogenase 1 B-type cytochrome subunit